MKNHDIHENKNVCPEFNGEKMHEHSVFPKMSFWQTLSPPKTPTAKKQYEREKSNFDTT